ncbi:hypothetical protein PTSG_10777 [Salpingoeca rosetta]|uniref:Uncharacterized protein n=1 Tax=Salpingoeca rosetta (strain ATCC 50818 / BSB-021) TaxID=946362 RepID=F2UQC4_SALR5|nr:uncharacterized protein PTSG_10777 [Salpingoeca rosetta]EGD79792.1 hypothetical protein PTSG_10777 [Salpingoeca rosetta]|eukprot:XP_004988741.1 hypothetical protein PTSG_10777 [Salpingoeca rosetta]
MRLRLRAPLLLLAPLCLLLGVHIFLVFFVGAEVVLEEDEHGAFHINTTHPQEQHKQQQPAAVFVNGVNVAEMFELIQEQQSMLRDLDRVNTNQARQLSSLDRQLCDITPPTVDTTTITGLGTTSTFKWSDGVLATNGLIYFIPFSASSIVILDPSTNGVDDTTMGGFPTDHCDEERSAT